MTQDLMAGSTIGLAALPALLQSWKVPVDPEQRALMLLETMPRQKVAQDKRQDLLRFEFFQPDCAFAQYQAGRVFHEHGEIRWEGLSSDEARIVYTGDPAYRPDLPGSQERIFDVSVYERIPREYFLFGKRLEQDRRTQIGPATQEGDFAEVRIPRLLRYPRLSALQGAERVQLALYEYTDLATGAIIAYRFYDLVPFKKREERRAL
ncbi:MAG TPA: CRISPR-associated protein Csx19 [Ktedonobacteraceae bacterium]